MRKILKILLLLGYVHCTIVVLAHSNVMSHIVFISTSLPFYSLSFFPRLQVKAFCRPNPTLYIQQLPKRKFCYASRTSRLTFSPPLRSRSIINSRRNSKRSSRSLQSWTSPAAAPTRPPMIYIDSAIWMDSTSHSRSNRHQIPRRL